MNNASSLQVYTLRNAHGSEVQILNFGATIISVKVPDRDGRVGEVTLGLPDPEGYLGEHPYLGGTIGRFANRIAEGRFSLDGKDYQLATNNGPNHLHGGKEGFNCQYWTGEWTEEREGRSVRLSRTSPEGEEHYPGTLNVQVSFSLSDDDVLAIEYRAETDAPTIINLTNHSYFNLTGDPSKDVLGHLVQIYADGFTPVDEHQIPLGDIRSVQGTPFDFRIPKSVGRDIDADDEQIRRGPGYDHNFALHGRKGDLEPAAWVYDPVSGRTMAVRTTEPGIQFYSGNFLDGTVEGRDGVPLQRRHALALETQHFPDSPNQPAFPSVVLRPGDVFHSVTTYAFGTLGGE